MAAAATRAGTPTSGRCASGGRDAHEQADCAACRTRSGTSYVQPCLPPVLAEDIVVSASLLPGATDQRAAQRPTGTRATALDHVHDHVLRLLGDRAAAHRVTTDVAVRAADRATSDPTARKLEQLLRSAHARIATVDAADTCPDDLVELLAGDVDGGRQVTVGLATIPTTQAALLDLTRRHGLDLVAAARVLGLDRRSATAELEQATAALHGAVAEQGAGLHLEVRQVLRQLPLVPAPSDCTERLAAQPRTGQRPPVRPWLAWATTGVITLVTFGLVASTLARAAEPGTTDAPVATAVAIDSGPAARQLAVPGDDRAPAEELQVRPATTPSDDEPDQAATDAGASPEPTASPSNEAAAPSPEPEPSPTATATPSEQPTEPEEPSEEPSPEPSPDEPLDLLPSP